MASPPEISDHQLSRVCISISCKEGLASFSIDHNPARQSLWLPAYPSSAVPEALPDLYSNTAFYAAQWEKLLMDPEAIDRDTRMVSVPGDDMPDGIAPSKNADALLEIALRHADPELARRWPIRSALRDDTTPSYDNSWQFDHEIEVFNEYGITRLGETE